VKSVFIDILHSGKKEQRANVILFPSETSAQNTNCCHTAAIRPWFYRRDGSVRILINTQNIILEQ
jgi:hypothetical protein